MTLRMLANLLGKDETPRQNIARLFKRDIASLLDRPCGDEPGQRFLLWTPLAPWPHMFLEFAIATHLRLRGQLLEAAICDGGLPHCELERANFPRPACECCSKDAESATRAFALNAHRLGEYVSADDIRDAERRISRLDEDGVRTFEYQGIDIGAFACRYLTTYYQGFVSGAHALDVARRALCGELVATMYAERLFETFRPDVVFMLSGNLCQYYGAFRVFRQLGAHVVTWDEGPQWDDGFYFAHNDHAGDVPLGGIWEAERHKSLGEGERQAVVDYYGWLREGTINDRNYHPLPDKDPNDLSERLGLEPRKRAFVGFANVVWDSNVLTKNVGFESMQSWIAALLEWFQSHPDEVLILRAHPGEKRIPLAAYETLEESTLQCLLKASYPSGLPSNVRLIPADDNAYSYTLADLSQAIGVYTSNIGLELALEGRKSWVAGQSISRGKGFTLDIQSPDHLRAELARDVWDDRLTEEEIDLAFRFANVWVFRFTTRLPYLRRVNTAYPQVLFKDLNFLKPNHDPALDAIAGHFLDGTPFLDIPRETNAVWKIRGERMWRTAAGRVDGRHPERTDT